MADALPMYDYSNLAQQQDALVGQERKVILLVADISGYTNLLTTAELNVAARIVNHITERVFNATMAPFVVNEIEGDALYVYAVHGDEENEALFIQTLKQLEAYADAFYHAMDELSWSNLRNDPSLRPLLGKVSMKFVVHYGKTQFHKIGPFVKLVGADGILIHRLLKNNVESDSYFLFTKAFLALDEDQEHAKAMAHVEEIKHFGSVDIGVRIFDYQKEHAERHATDHDHLTRKDLVL